MTRCTNCKQKGHNKRTCKFGMWPFNEPGSEERQRAILNRQRSWVQENDLPDDWEEHQGLGGYGPYSYYYCPHSKQWVYNINKVYENDCYRGMMEEAQQAAFEEEERLQQERFFEEDPGTYDDDDY